MAVDSVSVTKKTKSPKTPSLGNVTHSSPVPKGDNKSSGIRVQPNDPAYVKTCHQCRHKPTDSSVACQSQRDGKPCSIVLCRKCLLNRYGEKVEEVSALGDWSCPKCRGICNCSVCMKKRGHQPTGQLTSTAKATGFLSVSEMLLKGAVNCEKNVTDKNSPKKEVVISPRKRGKENSVDGKVDLNIQSPVKKSKEDNGAANGNISSKTVMLESKRKAGVALVENSLHGSEQKSKKMKHGGGDKTISGKNDNENLKKTSADDVEKTPKKSKSNGLEKNATLERRTSPRKLEASKKMSNQGAKPNVGINLKENVNHRDTVTEKELPGSFVNNKKSGSDTNDKNSSKHQSADIQPDFILPLGNELTSVAGIDVRAEDVGNALQFLEFCAVFGKILELRRGQAEYVLRDLFQGRTARRGKFSLTMQFQIQLLSVIQTDQGEECTMLSPSYGTHSWYPALKKCLSESQTVLKAQELNSIQTAADYETLDPSQKLRVLNFLCDEVLQTEKVRNWIDLQNTKLADKVKEAKQKVVAAKDKEKSLKQKMKDDVAKAISEKNGASLTISEHDDIVSKIKSEAAKAHADVLESEATILKIEQTCDAVRTEPLSIGGGGGDVYWKLNWSRKSEILRQDVGKGDALTFDEKWFAIDVEGKEAIEKHICSSREKRLRAPRVRNISRS